MSDEVGDDVADNRDVELRRYAMQALAYLPEDRDEALQTLSYAVDLLLGFLHVRRRDRPPSLRELRAIVAGELVIARAPRRQRQRSLRLLTFSASASLSSACWQSCALDLLNF
jgi:hypothetical protein